MRYRLLQIMLLCVMSVSTFAQDSVTEFIERCTQAGKTNAFCQCTLTAMSDQRRGMDKRQLPNLLLNHQSELEFFLSDPAITQDKVDAACDLHDAAMALELKSSQSVGQWQDKASSKALLQKKLALLDEKEALVMSYQASPQVNGSLIKGNFCANRYKITQIQQHLAEGESVLYGSVREMIANNPNISLRPFFVNAQRAGCR